MTRHIMMVNYTAEGMANIEDSPDRLDDGKSLVESMGGEVVDFYLTMGRYDLLVVVDGLDDDAMAKVALTLGREGAIETETLKAWPEDEYREIIAGLP
ncbi:GYD domain-containing protein [Halogeometricum rufum]|nr:GYD domain-containing protein [Halogeometricum rufum]